LLERCSSFMMRAHDGAWRCITLPLICIKYLCVDINLLNAGKFLKDIS
jgi:hypothetical protein